VRIVGWPAGLLILLGTCLVVAVVASSRININEFSIHHFYKNRLVRCYLGASNSLHRKPNRLTGFDPRDDFPIADLVPNLKYQGPYAIVNTALNLNAGSELAKQERKAASFVFTPRVCGFAPSVTKEDEDVVRRRGDDLDRNGYRATRGYSPPQRARGSARRWRSPERRPTRTWAITRRGRWRSCSPCSTCA
jgi:hypothetical protein